MCRFNVILLQTLQGTADGVPIVSLGFGPVFLSKSLGFGPPQRQEKFRGQEYKYRIRSGVS